MDVITYFSQDGDVGTEERRQNPVAVAIKKTCEQNNIRQETARQSNKSVHFMLKYTNRLKRRNLK